MYRNLHRLTSTSELALGVNGSTSAAGVTDLKQTGMRLTVFDPVRCSQPNVF